MVRDAGKERTLLDLSKNDPSGKTALDWFFPSFTGKLLAYGISSNGDENSVLHVMDVQTGKLMAERIPDTRWCDVTWLRDDSGFFYRRFPPNERYSPRLYFHRLGAAFEKDEEIFGAGLDKTFWPSTTLSEDGNSLAITVSRGWSASDLYWMDVQTRAVKPLVKDVPALFENAWIRDGKLHTITNLDAPRGRLIRIDPSKPEKAAWETVVPQSAQTLKGFVPLKGKLLTVLLDRAVSRLRIHGNDGKPISDVTLPGVGSVAGLDGRFDRDTVVLEFTSFTTAPRLLTLDTSKKAPPAVLAEAVSYTHLTLPTNREV